MNLFEKVTFLVKIESKLFCIVSLQQKMLEFDLELRQEEEIQRYKSYFSFELKRIWKKVPLFWIALTFILLLGLGFVRPVFIFFAICLFITIILVALYALWPVYKRWKNMKTQLEAFFKSGPKHNHVRIDQQGFHMTIDQHATTIDWKHFESIETNQMDIYFIGENRVILAIISKNQVSEDTAQNLWSFAEKQIELVESEKFEE